LLEPLHICQLKLVDAVFNFGRFVDFVVAVHTIDVDVPHLGFALQRHHNAVETVGDLDTHRVECQTARLLEIGELGDLLTIQPNFPTQAPGTERR